MTVNANCFTVITLRAQGNNVLTDENWSTYKGTIVTIFSLGNGRADLTIFGKILVMIFIIFHYCIASP